MPKSIALAAYLAFSARAAPIGRRILNKRLANGREDPERIGERRGEASAPRPDGPLVWFHAASVGESLSLLEVIRRLRGADPDLNFLITTGTVSSAEILAARLPRNVVHQYVPLDVKPYVERFLTHWKPDLAIWTESELWPCLLTRTSDRGTPLLLLNARLSRTSQKRWKKIPGAAAEILGRFKSIQAQDDLTAEALIRFGVPREKLAVTGTLKEGTPPPPCDEDELSRLTKLLSGRPLWAATSTHEGEEVIMAAAHTEARQIAPRLLLILVPRHPERGAAIASMLRDRGILVASRSEDAPLTDDTQVYLADTLGELGLWYRLAPISFVGGSLVDVGGHNPYEPAALGSAILHGPFVRNFADIYNRLDMAEAAKSVKNAADLANEVSALLQPDKRAPLAYKAWEVSSAGADTTDKAIALIMDHLPASKDKIN